MKTYKVFTIIKPKAGVVLEVELEKQLNIFANDDWSLKQIIQLSFKEDALGLVILEKLKSDIK